MIYTKWKEVSNNAKDTKQTRILNTDSSTQTYFVDVSTYYNKYAGDGGI